MSCLGCALREEINALITQAESAGEEHVRLAIGAVRGIALLGFVRGLQAEQQAGRFCNECTRAIGMLGHYEISHGAWA